jgi:pimeloyl-ACP methyl ester carboxylesterase
VLLASSEIAPRTGRPSRHALFLHGILGSRSNWRSVARAWVDRHAGWGAVLPDLRMHGESQPLDPPHTVASAAADLDELAGELEAPVELVVGHSFGGKVALAFAEQHGDIADLWLVDSMPGARPHARGSEDTVAVVSMLESLPAEWESREAFVERVVEEEQERPTAEWLAMNLERTPHGRYTMHLDLPAIRAMLEDYFARNLWHVLEHPPSAMRIHVVIGDRSPVWAPADRARVNDIVARDPRVTVHVLDTGHWVHTEAPDALLAAMTAAGG